MPIAVVLSRDAEADLSKHRLSGSKMTGEERAPRSGDGPRKTPDWQQSIKMGPRNGVSEGPVTHDHWRVALLDVYHSTRAETYLTRQQNASFRAETLASVAGKRCQRETLFCLPGTER